MTFSVGPNQYKNYSVGAINFDPRDIGHLGPFQPSRNLGAFENRPPYDVNSGVKPGLPRLNTAHELATGLLSAWPVLSWDTDKLLDLVSTRDLSPNATHGNLAKAYAADIGIHIDTSGQGGYELDLGAGDGLRTATSCTVAAWIRTTAVLGPYRAICSMWPGSAISERWSLGTDGSGYLSFQAKAGGTTVSVSTTGDYTDGDWHLVVGTWTASGNVTISIDGGAERVVSGSTLGATVNDSAYISVGNWDPSSDYTWPGQIADVRIWDRVLSEAEISRMFDDPWSLYTVTAKPEYPVLDTNNPLSDGLTAAYPFFEGGGTTVIDISDNGNHGTISSGGVWATDADYGPTWDNDSSGKITLPAGTINADIGISISFWIKGGPGVGGTLLTCSAGSDGIKLLIGVSNDLRVEVWDGWQYAIKTSTGVLFDGEWHHYTVTCDASWVRSYIDGVESSAATASEGVPTLSSTAVTIADVPDGTQTFTGVSLTDLRFFDHALPASDVADLAEDPWLLYLDGTERKPVTPVLDTSHELASGLVAALPFYELSGSNFDDLTSNDNDGVSNGGTIVYAPEEGPHWRNNPVTESRVRIESSSSLSAISTAVSWGGLFRCSEIGSTGRYGPIFTVAGPTRSFSINGNDYGVDGYAQVITSEGTYTATASGSTARDGEWHWIFATYDGSALRFYEDGEELGSTAASGTLDMASKAVQFADNDAGNDQPDLEVSDARIWNRAISAEEISRISSDPWALYKGTEAATPTSHDASATIPLPSLGITATASVSGSNDASATIPLPSLGITATATNVGANDASATIPLPSLGITATGNNERILDASASINLPSLGITATGSTIGANDASATITLPSLGITATAANITPGTNAAQADITLPSLGITGSGVNIGNNRTTANINLPSLGITASVTNLGHNDASAIVNLPRLGISASVVNVGNNDSSANVNLPSLGITASGSNTVPQVNQGTANIELPSLGITASSTNVGFNDASVSAGLPSLGISGTGRSYDPTVNIGSVIVAFGKLGLTASATNITPPRTVYPESRKTTFYETIVTSGTIESSAFVPSYEMRKKLYDLIRTSPDKHFKAIRAAFATFKTFLNDNLYIYNDQVEKQEVECISAKQERAIAKLSQEKNLILPLASLSLQDIDLYNEKQKYAPILVHDKYWDDEAKTAYRVIREVGKSVNISMDLHLWSKYMTDMVELAELVEFLFRPNLCLKSTEANNTKFFLDGSSDISETVVSDGENRILRKVYSIRCETYIYGKQFRVTNTGEIEEFNVEWEIDQ